MSNCLKVAQQLLVAICLLQLFCPAPLLNCVSGYPITTSQNVGQSVAQLAATPANVLMATTTDDNEEDGTSSASSSALEEETRSFDDIKSTLYNSATAFDKKSLANSNGGGDDTLNRDKFYTQSSGYLQHNSGRINFTPFILRKRQKGNWQQQQQPFQKKSGKGFDETVILYGLQFGPRKYM